MPALDPRDPSVAALPGLAALVNTRRGDADLLTGPSGLGALRAVLRRHATLRDLDDQLGSGHPQAELAQIGAIRDDLRAIWLLPRREQAVAPINRLLAGASERAHLGPDGSGWRLTLTTAETPLVPAIAAHAGLAFAALVCADEWDRLERCDAPDCDGVLVDLSRNRTRRYCADRPCGNRMAAAAYRARRRVAA